MKSNLFNYYKWVVVLVVLFFSYLPAQVEVVIYEIVIYNSVEEVIENVKVSVGKREMELKINQLRRKYTNLTTYYEDKDFSDNDSPALDLENAYPIEVYDEKFNMAVNKKLFQRYKRSLEYEKEGNIDKFYEINQDIIMKYPINVNAAKAAYALGKFEELIYTLGEAKKYYQFVLNSHFNTQVGPLAYIRYALVLQKESYHIKAEQLLLAALNNARFKGRQNMIALNLRKDLVSRAIWFWNKKQLEMTQYYLSFFDAINKYISLNKLRLEVDSSKMAR